MTNLQTRDEILNFLIEVELNPKTILNHTINTTNSIKNDYLNNELKSLLESYLLDETFTKKDLNLNLNILTKNVYNKF